MQKRCFGHSGHQSSVAIFGGAAFWEISQADADAVVEQVLAAGINSRFPGLLIFDRFAS